MRHQHMRGKAAVDRDAEMARRGADVLVARFARRALPAADPGIDRDLGAGLCIGIRAGAFDRTGDLVAEREGQRAPGAHVEFLAVAERK